LITKRKDEVFEADSVESKWNAMKEIWQKQQNKYVGGQKDHRGIVRHGGGMMRELKLLRRKEDAIRPEQQVIGISIRRQDEMQEVLLLHKKRQGKSLLMSWRVQQERRISTGLQNPGRMW